jgi:hypothetical protein
MRQLLAQHDDILLVGMKDRVFLLDTTAASSSSCAVLELSKASENPTPTTQAKQQHQEQTQQPRRDKEAELSDITAVAVTAFCPSPEESSPTVFCAVARYDKSLAIYQLRRQNGDWQAVAKHTEFQLPHMVYHTPKRVGCLTFARLAANESRRDEERSWQVLVSGDLAGDAYAYNLLEKGHRLLLGHTASMLTSVAMIPAASNSSSYIATADRDEKVRISRFPETYIVEGYLLGHTKYVTAIGSVPTSDDALLASCGGDKMLRLWNWKTNQELCSISTTTTVTDDESNDGIPVDLAISADGRLIAVVFDGSKYLNVYRICQETTQFSLSLYASIESPSQPLVVAFDQLSSNRVLVLMTEPHFLMGYEIMDEGDNGSLSRVTNSAPLQALKEKAEKESISIPTTILEKDQQGHPVLEKENETRGLNFDAEPWKRTERIAIAKEKQKKRNQKKRDKKKQKLDS